MADKKKRPRRFRAMRDWVALGIARVLIRIARKLPLEWIQRFGDALGSLASRLPGKRRQRVIDHLEIAFPEPAYDSTFRDQVFKESLRSTVKMGLETMWMASWTDKDDEERIHLENHEELEETIRVVRENGKGMIVLLAHHGATELMMGWFKRRTGLDVLAVAGKAKAEGFTEEMTRLREGGGGKVVIRGDAALSSLRHLRQGGALAMLVDHNISGPGVAVDFFGKKAHTLLAPSKLILQSGAVYNTIFPVRGNKPGTFLVRIGKPVIPPPYPRDKDERFRLEAQLTSEYTKRIEEAVRKDPGQYLWMHRRWMERKDTLPYPE